MQAKVDKLKGQMREIKRWRSQQHLPRRRVTTLEPQPDIQPHRSFEHLPKVGINNSMLFNNKHHFRRKKLQWRHPIQRSFSYSAVLDHGAVVVTVACFPLKLYRITIVCLNLID